MTTGDDQFLELHNSVLGELRASERLTVAGAHAMPLIEAFKKLNVADAPTRSLIVDAVGNPIAVLFMSVAADVDYVARGLRMAVEGRRMLGEDLGSVILAPLAEGDFRGLSYAVWPLHRPLTHTRGLAFLQKRFLLPRILGWLREATQRTMHQPAGEELDAAFIQPLTRMAQDSRFPLQSRELSQQGLARLKAGLWRPRLVLQHKDLMGNILLPRSRGDRRQFSRGFILIDWAGTNLRGSPFVNLLGLARPARMRTSVLRAELLRHCRLLSCEPDDIVPYVQAYLGHVGMHLGHFVESDYLSMCGGRLQFALECASGLRFPVNGR